MFNASGLGALPQHPVLLPKMNLAGWAQAFTTVEAGEGSSDGGRMGEAIAPQSPHHHDKRHRLSRLLDRLTVQICNNNHYETPHWLMVGTPLEPFCEVKEDLPLDLSKKQKKSQAHVVREEETFSCSVCGQAFAMHDRLAKHIASRHRPRTSDSLRQFECESCHRRFTRSDMLTRHARKHSGVKPYACKVCGQVFSRSDHLATHHRTHTGEKPYHCPACPYAACRRDMITRHMRTHTGNNTA